jgi:hypothetical protein
VLCLQAAELDRLIATVSSCCKFTLKSFEDSTCGAMEVLIARRELTDRLKELGTTSVQSPADSDSLSFDVRRDDITSIQNAINGLGVVGTGGAVPFETTVTGDGTRQCWPNKPTTVTITARDRKGAHVRVSVQVGCVRLYMCIYIYIVSYSMYITFYVVRHILTNFFLYKTWTSKPLKLWGMLPSFFTI